MNKTERIINRSAWFRSIRPGDVSKGKFKDCKQLRSVSVQLTDYNAIYGQKYGVFIHAKYLKEELTVILVGVTIAQRKKELSDPSCRNDWRKLIDEWEEVL